MRIAEIVAEQRSLWGTAPRDWAEVAERENEPLFLRVLDAAGVAAGTRLLGIGCGSGLLRELAAARGADVAGLDITPELLEIARERVPAGDFRETDMSVLPFADGNFDVAEKPA
ncbi:MAG TPA: class I SAM-dependent methyltransferase [Solirubrobacteraceae bacterium]|jgi:2-polyprenyl-3-methyl-5-hydroxy-6-metoxy-1,4-benzoquinol methylase|nr:class I SAM-dependent methyltransferase [Solirubrobacteraceae bacterium]